MHVAPKFSLVKALMEGIQEMVFIVRMTEDFLFYFEFMNQAAMENIGLDIGVIDKNFREVFSAEVANNLEIQYTKALKAKDIVVFETKFAFSSDLEGYAEFTLTPIVNNEGDCIHIVTVIKNSTIEKRTNIKYEENLQLLEEARSEYRSLFENNADAIFTINLASQIQNGNPRVEKISGYSIDELKGLTIFELVDPEDHEKVQEALQKALDGQLKDYRIHFLNKYFKKIGCLLQLAPIKVRDKVNGFFVIVKDMRELDKLVGKYVQSQKNFQIIAENVQDVVILMNHELEYLYISPSSKNVFGLNNEVFKDKPPFFYIHPDNVEQIQEKFQQSILDGKSYTVHLKVRHSERGWIWSEVNGTPVYDEQNNFRHMVLVARDITLQRDHEDKLQYFAYHDSLTGLPNRRLFKNRLSEALIKQEETGVGFAVILIDIDEFKQINDNWGHEAGDYVIHEFGNRLSSAICPTDFVARLGGDEFIILMADIEKEEHVVEKIKIIQQAVEVPWNINGFSNNVTTSIGIALSTRNNCSASYILKSADNAMYEAKKAGKNIFRINRS